MMSELGLYNFFWRIEGEDCQLLRNSERKTKNWYLFSGIILVNSFFLTFISFYYSFLLLFDQVITALASSLIISIIYYIIYKLNLITLAPKKVKDTLNLTISLAVRIIFLLVISLSISKPLETLLFGKTPLKVEDQSLISNLNRMSSEYPESWAFTVVFVIFYLAPFFIKMTSNPSNSYAKSKLEINEKIIEENYTVFKIKYSEIFEKSYGLKIEVIEKYSDPPFNTKRRKNVFKTGSEKDFLNHLHGL